MNTNETWLPIAGWEEHYEVSNLGRVRSLDRTVEFLYQGKPRTQFKKGQILKGTPDPESGYPRVNICSRQRGIATNNRFIHHLVLEAFVGACPEGMEASHLDGDKTNNCLSNLEWDTHASQLEHAVGKPRGVVVSRLSDETIRLIRQMYDAGEKTVAELRRQFDITYSYCSKIVHRKVRVNA